MYPAAFDYHAPKNVKEALGLLGKLRDDAKILAGGHSLIPMMKLRLAQPKHLIDLRKVAGLTGIKEDKGMIAIGAITTHWEVESSKVLKSKCPVVSETAAMIGDPAVRNKGTIGGTRKGRGGGAHRQEARRRRDRGRGREGRRRCRRAGRPAGLGGVQGAPLSRVRQARDRGRGQARARVSHRRRARARSRARAHRDRRDRSRRPAGPAHGSPEAPPRS